jgi:restriction system protein
MHLASRLPWRISLALAAISGLLLHGVASVLSTRTPVSTTGELGTMAVRGFYGTIAFFLQFIIPAAFLFGALGSYVRRSHARGLFQQAREDPGSVATGMTWGQFERLVGEAFRGRGFDVTETDSHGSDGGVDLVLTKDDKRYLVQCKHWRVQKVGVGVVRELNGVIAAQGAAGGYVVTCGRFTQEASEFAHSCRIELIGGDTLNLLIRKIKGEGKEEEGSRQSQNGGSPVQTASCPRCGSGMTQRVAKRGAGAGHSFWGCSRYPACRGTRSMA